MRGSLTAAQLEWVEQLLDSQFRAGVKVGWNLGVCDDAAGYRSAMRIEPGALSALGKWSRANRPRIPAK